MKETVKKIGKNEYSYKDIEFTKYPHLKGYWGHYKIGKKMFTLRKEVIQYIDEIVTKSK